MKKVLAFVLALVLALTVGSVMAFAEEQPQIVVDGVKDAAYTDFKSFTYETWIAYDNNGQTLFDPVDPERVINTVWFDWDDDSVYLYFQCVSKDALYKPAEGETQIPDFDFGDFYEMAQIYLDTAPSIDWWAACSWAGTDGNGDFCNHMCCNCREGAEGSRYRLMARANPAFNQWNDYYATASGMFMSYETFCEKYAGREGYDDLAAKYAEAHGNGEGQAVSFIDYETNTYGFELKFPRAEGEDHFQFNIRTRVNETVWEDEGPELAYSMSFCPAWWMNSDGLIEVWYEDYERDDPQVAAIQRQIAELPAVDLLELEHKDAVNTILTAYEGLTEAQITLFADEEIAWILGAAIKMEYLSFVAALGDVNDDGNINATDALVVLRASVGKVDLDENQILRADVNGDEKTDAKDALEILQFTVGKREEFSIVKLLEME